LTGVPDKTFLSLFSLRSFFDAIVLTHLGLFSFKMAAANVNRTVEDSKRDSVVTESPLIESSYEEDNVGKRPEFFSSTLQECLFVLTATMSIGMSSFLQGSCTVITASIGRSLNMTSAQITWITASSA